MANCEIKATVIITCYNLENFIEQSILSAVAQKTNFDFEILVRDDLSSDGSIDVIGRLANLYENIKVFKGSENLGVGRNIEFLMSQAKGEYIAYLDGDDYWIDVDKLQKQVDFLDENPTYSMTFTGHWMKYPDGRYVPEMIDCWLCLPQYFENGEVTTDDLLNANWASFGKVFRNIKGIIKPWLAETFITELGVYSDWGMNFEFSKHGNIKYLDFPGGIYRQHDKGIFSTLDKEDIERRANIYKEKLKENL